DPVGPPLVDAAEALARLEHTVDLLRREWRAGFPAGMAYQTAVGTLRRLGGHAPNERGAAGLAAGYQKLETYKTLPSERRSTALTAIADDIKRIMPELAKCARVSGADRSPRSGATPRGENASARVVSHRPEPAVKSTSPRLALTDPVTVLKGAGGAT